MECECGCRRQTNTGRRFIRGHNAHRDRPALKHGHTVQGRRPPEYRAYLDARDRCTKPSVKNWKNYGGRGIEFRFTSLEQFLAEVGPRPTPLHQLDRINNDGNYEPGNVRWATAKENMNNRRSSNRPVPPPMVALFT